MAGHIREGFLGVPFKDGRNHPSRCMRNLIAEKIVCLNKRPQRQVLGVCGRARIEGAVWLVRHSWQVA